ncbi:hypothetical protein CHARACLAT_031883 [Characodon lateralis]|uniref:Uncharacterized protein n=1 Tax=Characodon lateralis TaxID=208331 RepID=A0ABU7EET6_9TELE|nr:hypothetical protein [Characodon lateralis]
MAVTEEDSHPQDVRQQGPSTLEIPQGPAAAPEIVGLVSIEESGSAGWKIEPDPSEAAERFKEGLLGQHETEKTRSSHFFSTVMSKLQYGFDIQFAPGGTLLFEGEKDHLIPSTSHFLLESDFFLVAGRMIGHWFLHGGPCLGGLSTAIMHVLFGGSPEEATTDLKVDGAAELSSEGKDTINVVGFSSGHLGEQASLPPA